MKEPSKSEIAKAVIALLNLQNHQSWMITPQLRQAIKDCIEDLRFYYQFAHND